MPGENPDGQSENLYHILEVNSYSLNWGQPLIRIKFTRPECSGSGRFGEFIDMVGVGWGWGGGAIHETALFFKPHKKNVEEGMSRFRPEQ